MDLYDKNGKIIGRMMQFQDASIKLYSRTGSYLGYYDPKEDKTYNRSGSFVGTGNLLATLIIQP